MLKGKTIVLGVTGSIAAYKIANLARMIKKLGGNVHVLMTRNAENFINPFTFETLTQNKCLIDTFDRGFEYSVEHVSVAKQADADAAASGKAVAQPSLLLHAAPGCTFEDITLDDFELVDYEAQKPQLKFDLGI